MDALAPIEDFADRVPGGIGSADTARAQAMLDDASALIRAEAGMTWDGETVPDVVKTICLSAAKRAFLNPDGINSLSLDGNAATFATGSPDVYLTKAEIRAVRTAAGRSVLWTQSTTRTEGDDDDGTGEPDTPGVLADIYTSSDDELDSGPLSDFFD